MPRTYLLFADSEAGTARVQSGAQKDWRCEPGTRSGDRLLIYIVGEGLRYEWEAISDAASRPGQERPTCRVTFRRAFTPAVSLSEISSYTDGKLNLKPGHIRRDICRPIDARFARRLWAKLDESETPAVAQPPGQSDSWLDEFMSTQSRATRRFSSHTLVQAIARSKQATIFSAYYDVDFVLETLGRAQTLGWGGRLRLVVNRMQGVRGSKLQRDDLRRLVDHAVAPIEVKLQRAPGIFHSKLYAFDDDVGGRVYWAGSANLSRAGFDMNEEMLISIRGRVKALDAYISETWSGATSLDDDSTVKPKTIASLLRVGWLFSRLNNPLTTTYNPFRKLRAILDPSDRRALSVKSDIPFSEDASVLAPFALQKALDIEPDDDEPGKKTTLKQRGIETCFGMWVPDDFVEAVLGASCIAVEQRRNRLVHLGDLLRKSRRASRRGATSLLMRRYREYLARTREFIESRGVNIGKYLPGRRTEMQTRLTEDPFTDVKGFERFVDTIQHTLTDERQLMRRAQPFAYAPMPWIWDDPLAAAEFEESFFDSVVFAIQKRRANQVAKTLRTVCGDHQLSTAAEVRKKLKSVLAAGEWKGWSLKG